MVKEDFKIMQEQDLSARIPAIHRMRADLGLEGFVHGLDSLIINTEPDRLYPACTELLRYTGHTVTDYFDDAFFTTYVLGIPHSASILLRARKKGKNPFKRLNIAEKTLNFPNTRLETFLFRTTRLEEFVEIQSGRGIQFISPGVLEYPAFRFIQTQPSRYTGNSIGFIEWMDSARTYAPSNAIQSTSLPEKPLHSYLSDVHGLDHTATRVRALDRNDAIIEFMELTGYNFDFAVFVKSLNSITSVVRLMKDDFAMVFTSGIEPFQEAADSGPTEMFIRNYGTRVHHMAFQTDHIDETFDALQKEGMEFLVDLVGSENEGLKQTFSVPSPNTMIVSEYIYRYKGFDGFFTKSNVEMLTRATGKQ